MAAVLPTEVPATSDPVPDAASNIRTGQQHQAYDEFFYKGFLNFLNSFCAPQARTTSEADGPQPEYVNLAKLLIKRDRTTLEVNFKHVQDFDPELAERILTDYYHQEKTLKRAVNDFIHSINVQQDPNAEYQLSFFDVTEQLKVRDLRTSILGQLTRITGTVTRTSEVRPELVQGFFQCLECRTNQDLIDQQFKYTEPLLCKNPTCQNRKSWYLQVDKSKFCDFQKVRVQENANEIPAGSMPRTIDVIVRNEMADRAKPGDKCVFTGSLIVVPDLAQLKSVHSGPEAVRETGNRSSYAMEGVTGLRALGVRELNYRLNFLACAVHLADAAGGYAPFRDDGGDDTGGSAAAEQFDEETVQDAAQIRRTPNLYARLVSSVCPTVFGHEEIKKGILLMMLGGLHKTTRTGTNLRGDINVCIVGDPSCAKSQFLKYVSGFMPRAVYTSGKASSAAGLTASVIKDPETGEFGIEAGALMLADNGICCIDEFDKMDQKDQVAIHEAMEQQTISIAKAGIQATLNARTSILAAANPRDGRYDRARSLRANVDITAPIMSRFDLFFVILDECNEITDYNIARHIVDVHMRRESATQTDFSKERLQRYVQYARAAVRPKLTPEAAAKLSEYYRELRENDCTGAQRAAYRITVRQLESMIRLSEAIAKLHCDDKVQVKYVDEAKRLLKQSIIHVDSADLSLDDFEVPEDEEHDEQQPDDDADNQDASVGGAPPPPPPGGDDDEPDDGAGGAGGAAPRTPVRRSGRGRKPEAGEAAAGRSPASAAAEDDAARESPGQKRRRRGAPAEEEPAAAVAAAPAAADGDKAAEGGRRREGEDAPAAKTGKTGEEEGAKKKLEISQDEYDSIANMLVRELRRREESEEEEWTQGELVEWYLMQRDDLDSEEAFAFARRAACAIVQRMITQDGILLVLNQDEADQEPTMRQRRDARKLAVHPNYVPFGA